MLLDGLITTLSLFRHSFFIILTKQVTKTQIQHMVTNSNVVVNIKNIYQYYLLLNKRAQRALGRSPEEKVKGQGEAIYRGPLMLSTKYW